jgi:hypothetical protein
MVPLENIEGTNFKIIKGLQFCALHRGIWNSSLRGTFRPTSSFHLHGNGLISEEFGIEVDLKLYFNYWISFFINFDTIHFFISYFFNLNANSIIETKI